MSIFFSVLALQIVLGLFDNVYHHEYKERLPGRGTARAELALHAGREFVYGVLFFAFAWFLWRGAWAWLIGALLLAEVVITLADFIVEDRTRRLPRLERATHTLMAINYGVLLALFTPHWFAWASAPTQIVTTHYGIWSWALTACGLGVLLFSVRNGIASMRHFAAQRRRIPLMPFYHNPESRRVLVTGGTGFIGRYLVKDLVRRGHSVVVLSRKPHKARALFGRQITVVSDLDTIPASDVFDVFINLAGPSVAGWWWTKSRKRYLIESRLKVTNDLLRLADRLERKPQTWINASAVGYYGVQASDDALHEKSPSQNIFQSEMCVRWEEAAAAAKDLGVSVSMLRIGLVLGQGGLMPRLMLPVRLGFGMPLGSGLQWMSWIHIDDLVRLIHFLMEQRTLAGPVNAVSPAPVIHKEFMETLARRLDRWMLPIHVPRWMLQFTLGELSQLMIDGQRIVPERARALGFRFHYPELEQAFVHLIPSRGTGVAGKADEVPCPE